MISLSFIPTEIPQKISTKLCRFIKVSEVMLRKLNKIIKHYVYII